MMPEAGQETMNENKKTKRLFSVDNWVHSKNPIGLVIFFLHKPGGLHVKNSSVLNPTKLSLSFKQHWQQQGLIKHKSFAVL